MKQLLKCLGCGKEYKKRSDNSKYCSADCQHPNRHSQIKCATCGKMYHAKASRIACGRGKYCSKGCYNVSRRTKPYLDKEWLVETYKDKSAVEIAKDCGVCASVVQMAIKKFGIKVIRRKLSEDHKKKISAFGRRHSPETKEKIRVAQLGEKGHNWKGGKRVKDRLRSWKSMKKVALERDGNACTVCGKSIGLIDVHHKTPFRCFKSYQDANDPRNLITLCRQCHFVEEAKKTFRNCRIGSNPVIWNYVNLYECEIGNNVKIGAYTEIGPAVIGDNVTIGSSCFIPANITIEDDSWIGPGVKFCNDRFPPSSKEQWEKTIVKKGARIGEAVTVLPGVIIGEGSLIGAGSVVTKSVPPNETWAGNPARLLINANPKEFDIDKFYSRA